MGRKQEQFDRGLENVVKSALADNIPSSAGSNDPTSGIEANGSGATPADNELLADAIRALPDSEPDSETPITPDREELEPDSQDWSRPGSEIVGFSSNLIDAETRDNIADALTAQDYEIERNERLLDQIDARLKVYADTQVKLDDLKANALRRRAEVEAAYDAAQLARAMLNTKRSKRVS